MDEGRVEGSVLPLMIKNHHNIIKSDKLSSEPPDCTESVVSVESDSPISDNSTVAASSEDEDSGCSPDSSQMSTDGGLFDKLTNVTQLFRLRQVTRSSNGRVTSSSTITLLPNKRFELVKKYTFREGPECDRLGTLLRFSGIYSVDDDVLHLKCEKKTGRVQTYNHASTRCSGSKRSFQVALSTHRGHIIGELVRHDVATHL